MSLLGGWILAPFVLGVLVCGLGLLAERIARVTLPGALVPGAGLAVLIVVAGVPSSWDPTAELTVPLVAALALAGFALARPWRDARLHAAVPGPALLALAVFAVFAAPSLLSGQGGIAGYVKLDDSATWLVLTEHVLHSGRDISMLPESGHTLVLRSWLGGGYPVGAFLGLGVTGALSGQDLANAYQPVIATYAAILALGLYACVRELVGSRGLAAGAALIGVQASLFIGYAHWGGIKEAAVAALLPPLAWLAARGNVLALVAAGALAGSLGVNGFAWGAPALLVALIAWRPPLTARSATTLSALVPLLAIASLPALAQIEFLQHTRTGAISAGDELGNLASPLSLLQGAGLWPVGDFRADPDPKLLAIVLALGGLLAATAAVALAVRRRAWALPALAGITVAGVVPAVVIGSPWVDAKALAVLAPILLAATAALAAVGLRELPAAGAAGALVLVAGTAWSTLALQRDVFVAPRERHTELRSLSERVAGPVVQLDFDIYGNRWFLRDRTAEGATDLRSRRVARRDGQLFAERTTAEVDEMATAELWAFRSVVRRRNPVASRPPSAFARAHAGPAWEVWTRAADAPAPLGRLPLGDALQPSAVPDCNAVRQLARTPGASELAAVPRTPTVIVDLAQSAVPPPWLAGGTVRPSVDGTGAIAVGIPRAGRWRVWVGGSTLGSLRVRLGDSDLGEQRHELAHTGQWLRFGAVHVASGPQTVSLRYRRGGLLAAGRGAPAGQAPLGPLALTAADSERPLPVMRVPARSYRRLCDGRSYDWIEALG